jgi:hypothetical protein
VRRLLGHEPRGAAVGLPLGVGADGGDEVCQLLAGIARERGVGAEALLVSAARVDQCAPSADSQRSASSAAMQPVPAAVTAWR